MFAVPDVRSFTPKGDTLNLHGEFAVESDFLKKVVAAFVVETLWESIGFQGHTPLLGTIAHQHQTLSSLQALARDQHEAVHSRVDARIPR